MTTLPLATLPLATLIFGFLPPPLYGHPVYCQSAKSPSQLTLCPTFDGRRCLAKLCKQPDILYPVGAMRMVMLVVVMLVMLVGEMLLSINRLAITNGWRWW